MYCYSYTTMHTYDKANQLVSSTTDGKVTHYADDAAGRLIKEGDKSYSYGWLDKVLSVTEKGQQIARFNYHNDGQIAQAIHNGKSEDFLWDGLALIHRGETSFINEPYVTGGNPILSSKDGVMFNDMLGSTLNIGCKAVNMTAFGESIDTNVMYTGKPYIGELGYAFLFRNYRSDYGKWQTSDPLGYPDGWNNLAYCGNYPLLLIDSNGAVSWVAVGVGAAIGALGYGVSCAISGESFSLQGCIAAASGGAVAGAIAGAVTGDVSALAVIRIAAGASAAGKFIENTVNEILNSMSDDIQFNVKNLGDGVLEAAAFGGLGGAGSCAVKLKFNSLVTPENFDNCIAAITGFSIETSSVIYDEIIDAYDAFKDWYQQLGQDRINKINQALNE